MKLFVLSALLMLTAFTAHASEEQPFVLAMDYSVYLRMAQNDTFGEAKKALIENPYEKKDAAIAEEISSEDDEKWHPVKDFKKTKNLTGGGFANYQYDDIDENRLNEAYSVKINVNIAL